MIKNIVLFLCTLFLLPMMTSAQVIINEIAWMGTALSANDEWIELHNTGSDTVSLSGWKLTAQDGDPKITLSGEIPAGGYFLLERSDDESVPGISAGVIYTGGLGNTGETLELFDAGGGVVDSVVGGTNWSLGGDNTAKNTPQRQADNVWITGVPTPGLQNSTEHIASSTGEVQGASTSTASTSSTKKKTTTGYTQNVFAYAGADIETVVGAYAFFEGYGVDALNNHISVSKYQWSFGDGDDGDGKESTHIYTFPGTYTAVVSIGSHYQHARDSVSVSVTQADVQLSSVVLGANGYIEIFNNSDVPLDMSLWKLQAEYAEGKKRGRTFTIPLTTTIAPHTKVPFPSVITNILLKESDRVALVYPSGKEASAFEGALYNAESMSVRHTKKK